ncbi:MAG: hypothetical protein AB7O13_24765 [Alphaproteobacteria bacterium]
MVQLMRLPGYDAGNTLLNLMPINEGLDSIVRNAQLARQNQRADARMSMDRERFALDKQRLQTDLADRAKKKAGNLAMLVLNEPDPAKRAAKWQEFLALHPDGKSLDERYRNPETGPMMALSEAGMANEYLSNELRNKNLALQNSQLARQNKLTDAQLAQLKNQTPDYRASIAKQYGLDPSSPGYQHFVLNGTLPTKSTDTPLDKAVAKSTVDLAEKDIQAALGAKDVLASTAELKRIAEDPNLGPAIGPVQGNSMVQTAVNMIPFSQTIGLNNPALNQRIQQIGANIVLAAQQKLKGLGAASDADSRRVEETVGKLANARTKEEFLNAVNEIERTLQNTMARGQAAAKQYPSLGSRLNVTPAPSAPAAPGGGAGWSIKKIQ